MNYADVNLRNGTFYIHTKLPLPAILGNEGAGVVEGLGSNVDNVKVGDRVVYVSPSGMMPPGSYSQLRVINADQQRIIALYMTLSGPDTDSLTCDV